MPNTIQKGREKKDKEKMKHYLQSILIVLIAMIISAFLIAGMIWGIKLIIQGWQVVEEMRELLLVK